MNNTIVKTRNGFEVLAPVTELEYRGYRITRTPWNYPQTWEFLHDDYDGPPSKKFGTGNSIEDCQEQINDIEDL